MERTKSVSLLNVDQAWFSFDNHFYKTRAKEPKFGHLDMNDVNAITNILNMTEIVETLLILYRITNMYTGAGKLV